LDPISDIFRTLHIDALVQSKLEATAPWAVSLVVQPQQVASDGPFTHRPGVAYFGMISRGHCWLKVDGEGEAFPLAGGDCFLLAPQIAFSLSDQIHAVPVNFCDLRAKAIQNVVHHGGGGVPTTLIWGLLQFNQGSVRPITALLPRLILIRAEQAQTTGLQATLQLLASEMALRGPGSDVAANRLAEVLFVQTLRAYIALGSEHRKSGWLGAIFDPQIGGAMKVIHENIRAAWTVELMAEAAGMSRSSFAARFKQLLGETPMQYVMGWRIQKSLELLMRGDANLTEIGLQVGYETDAAFNKAFKRVIGDTPGQYRNTYLYRPRK
jgi:AraC-like DNA-binding protein